MKQIGIIGSGSWGTALSVLLAGNADKVIVWGREPSVIASINSLHQNPGYLPNVVLPDHVSATTTLADLATCDAVFVVVPSKAVRPVAQQLATLPLPPETPLVSCIKGIENGSGLRMSQLLSDAMPAQPVAVLSGPNHAEEIARRQPAAAVKNVFAIASGLASGLGLGDNARAALVTRGLAEMIRLGTAMGGNPATFQGLSGVGDLVVTCYSEHSRNNRVGQALGRGTPLPSILASMTMVAEGVPNTESIYHAARHTGVRTPIIDTVYAILYQGLSPQEGLRALFARDPRPEAE